MLCASACCLSGWLHKVVVVPRHASLVMALLSVAISVSSQNMAHCVTHVNRSVTLLASGCIHLDCMYLTEDSVSCAAQCPCDQC